MKNLSCNTLIIGAGSAGLEAYKAAHEKGVSCILIESGPLGTTSQRTGDIPSAILMAAAKRVRASNNLEAFGIRVQGECRYDTSEVMNALRAMRARGTTEILSVIYKIPENERIIGQARFVDTNTVEIIGQDICVSFKSAVIATGSTPDIPFEICKLGDILTTNDIFELDSIPGSIAVFGSGAEALQLGQALSYLGSDVTIFSRSNLWHLTDESVIQVAADEFSSKVNIAFNSVITEIQRENNSYGLYYIDDSNYENYLKVDRVLAVNMRIPRTQGLNLRAVGIELDSRGFVKIDERTMQTSLNHIFAAGNITDANISTVYSKNQGRFAGMNAATFPLINVMKERVPLRILDTDPSMAIVGLSLDMMRERAKNGFNFIVSESRTSSGMYRIQRKLNGIVRLYVDEISHEIMGAEMCASGSAHLAQFLSLCIDRKMTCEELAVYPFYNPTYEQILNDAAFNASRTLSRKKVV